MDALRPRPAGPIDAPAPVESKVHTGELLPDEVTPLEKRQDQAAASKAADLRLRANLQISQLAERREVKDFLRASLPAEFQAGGGGTLPGQTLRVNGFDLAASVEFGLKHELGEVEKEAKRQVVARRVEGGGNNGLGAMSVGATAMGIFFLGPLGAAAGIGSTLFDAVKGPELIFVNGKITGDQVTQMANRFARARGLPRAIIAALVRRALKNAPADLDSRRRSKLEDMLAEAATMSPELQAEGERTATVAIFARKLQRGLPVDDDCAQDALDALFGMAPANRRALIAGLRGVLFPREARDADAGAVGPRLSARLLQGFDAALS